jgi:hypothetical protein
MAAAAALMALPAVAQSTGTTTSSTDTTMGTNNNGTTTGSTYDNTATTGSTYDNGTATTTTTGTESTTVNGTATTPGFTAGPEDRRTHPAVPTHTEAGAMTATGTIVSWNHDELVLHTSNGITHFKMMPDTVGYNGPGTFQEGQTAAVDFNRNEQGVLIARQVRLGTTTTATTATTTSEPIATTTTTNDNTASVAPAPVPEAAPAPAPEVTTPPATTYNETPSTTTDTTTNETTSTKMPATASDSPLIALLGLAALGAAAGLRRL